MAVCDARYCFTLANVGDFGSNNGDARYCFTLVNVGDFGSNNGDARYCFTLVNVGDFGSNNDSGILAKSSVGKRFEEQKMKVPNAKPLLGYKGNLPYFLVGEEIFPLETWLMRPYPGTLSLAQNVFN